MRSHRIVVFTAAGVLALGAAACGSSGKKAASGTAASINGAGATFPAPVYEEWGSRLKDSQGITVNYNPIGSGGGIAQFTAKTVDFGATDSPMKPEEIAAAKKNGDPVHIPTVLGGITVSYNVSGAPKGLKLDGPTLADIFLGKVKTWNDPAIAKLNPGAKLPSTGITVVHRSDESGTTKNFTQFLANYSPAWMSGPGVDKTVKWPVGTGAKGNDGVAAGVKQTQGSIGYVELAYALQNNFTTAQIKNKAGNFVAPSLQSTQAAAQGLKVPADLTFSAIDAPGAQAYPIATGTFLLVYKDLCKAGATPDKAKAVVAWLNYALGDGQTVAPKLQYAALPPAIDASAKAKVAALTCNGSPVK